MGREALDATVTAIATRAALAAVVVAAVVILPAVLAGILDHLGRARRLAAALQRISPPTARRMAASCIAVIAMTSWVGEAAAADSSDRRTPSVREWLDGATTEPGAAEPSATWYPDPADPTGDSGPHGTIDLDDLDARTTTSTVAATSTTQPAPTTTTRRPTPRRFRRGGRTTSTTWARFTPPPYAGSRDPKPAAPPSVTPPGPSTYTVAPGDCLWTIAVHRLPPAASAAEIDRAWRAIYDANRAVIGSNPNLILPGQVLELPPLPTSA